MVFPQGDQSYQFSKVIYIHVCFILYKFENRRISFLNEKNNDFNIVEYKNLATKINYDVCEILLSCLFITVILFTVTRN